MNLFDILEELNVKLSGGALVAIVFVSVTMLVGRFLADKHKPAIGRVLTNPNDDDWAKGFMAMFNKVFGPKHLSWKCFISSACVSIFTVLVLYYIFDNTLNVFGTRTAEASISWKMLTLAALFNIFADYISLFETRVLLGLLRKANNHLLRVFILLLDVVLTSLIIIISLFVFFTLTKGFSSAPLALVEAIAIFSVYAVFFYSTFVTSVWTWIYAISSFLIYCLSKTPVIFLLDPQSHPYRSLALVGGIFSFIVVSLGTAVIPPGPSERVSAIDAMTCYVFSGTCQHIVKNLPEEDPARVEFEYRDCMGRAAEGCGDVARTIGEVTPGRSIPLYEKECERGDYQVCYDLGHLFSEPEQYGAQDFVTKDDQKSIKYYDIACRGEVLQGCVNAGVSYNDQTAGFHDPYLAREYYNLSCGGMSNTVVPLGCAHLADAYRFGNGGPQDYDLAFSYYRYGCDEDLTFTCERMGAVVGTGLLTVPSELSEGDYYIKACDYERMSACFAAGYYFDQNQNTEFDSNKANFYYQKACGLGSQAACANYERNRLYGNGLEIDETLALSNLEQMCAQEIDPACYILITYYGGYAQNQLDESRSLTVAEASCERKYYPSCLAAAELLERKNEAPASPDSQTYKYYKIACENQPKASCFGLGNYMRKNETAFAKAEIMEAFDKGCRFEDPYACNNLGVIYIDGDGIEQDVGQAVRYYEKGCRLGNATSCRNLGSVFFDDKRGVKNLNMSIAFYQQGCDLDDGPSCYEAGRYWRDSSENADVTTAKAFFEKGCNLKNGIACNDLGVLYMTGRGVEKNPQTGVDYYLQACSLDNGLGCSNLGYVYRNGTAAAKSVKLSVEYFSKACALGLASECTEAAKQIWESEGEAELSEAVRLFQKGCDQDISNACNYLGIMHIQGRGLEKDRNLAITYYKKACNLNNAVSCSNLAATYNIDTFSGKDLRLSIEYHLKACALGRDSSCNSYQAHFFPEKSTDIISRYLPADCTVKNSKSCNYLGSFYRKGYGLPVSFEMAETLFSKACENAVQNGCYMKGEMARNDYTPAKTPEAIEYYIKSCERGNASGCWGLAIVFGASGSPYFDQALRDQNAFKACDMDMDWACNWIAESNIQRPADP